MLLVGCWWVTHNFLCADMGQFDATKGKQALEIRSSLSERRALTDPILPGDSADLAHAHSRQWAKAHGEYKTLSVFFKYLFAPAVTILGSSCLPECWLAHITHFRHVLASQGNHSVIGAWHLVVGGENTQLSALPLSSDNKYLLMENRSKLLVVVLLWLLATW